MYLPQSFFSYTPPSTQEMFKAMMSHYREE